MKRLTVKEQTLVNLRAQGKTRQEAYKEAYNPPKTTKASTIHGNTSKILRRPHVKDAMEKALIKHDITLDNALSPVGKALKATHKVYNKETKEIEIIDDLDTQLKGSDRAIKLLNIDNNSGQSLHLHLHQARDKYGL